VRSPNGRTASPAAAVAPVAMKSRGKSTWRRAVKGCWGSNDAPLVCPSFTRSATRHAARPHSPVGWEAKDDARTFRVPQLSRYVSDVRVPLLRRLTLVNNGRTRRKTQHPDIAYYLLPIGMSPSASLCGPLLMSIRFLLALTFSSLHTRAAQSGARRTRWSDRSPSPTRCVPTGPIRLDGKLDESAWQNAPVTDSFTQVDPKR
jgi:hypothetical protein